ncbi:Tyrosine aminotransferase [Rhynchospora pubera]|uniref:Tyrosine aminotransferase n=1 Tax=Rhynchospora pubera TaxID=906938 RepID=A0AAV8FCR4_9POAL|nr:Tyrosine aminotransferase [Rhynchospora pubera]
MEKENGAKPSPEVVEKEEETTERWRFGENKAVEAAGGRSIRGTLNKVLSSVDENGPRPVIPLGHGDPSMFPSFRTPPIAEEAIVEAVRSAQFNNYAPTNGVLPARRVVAEYLSKDLPYKLSPDDVFLTAGCTQAIDIVVSALARPDANILLPRPGFPMYEARCTYTNLEMRHFDLIPEQGWEVDLDQVEKLADENTVAIVIINPNNPCGSVLKYQHMEEVVDSIRSILDITTDPATFIQGAVPQIIEKTKDDFFNNIIHVLRDAAELCYNKIKDIKCITCPHKPEGSMFVMVKLNLSYLVDISDDVDFCSKLAKEESVIIMPGSALEMKNWLRITFAVEPTSLVVGLERLKSFCERHEKN